MADDAPSPATSRSAADSASPAPQTAEGANDATTASVNSSPQKGDKKTSKTNVAADDNASGDEGGEDEMKRKKKQKMDQEEGGDEEVEEGAEEKGEDEGEAAAADDADKKTPKKKAASSQRKPNKRKSSGNLKGNGPTPATPSSSSKKTIREYKAEDLVLHKLKGYPPWPAVILSDEVAELKPDLVKTKPSGGSNKKGKSRNSIGGDGVAARMAYPVAYLHNFFEYSYAPISDLEPLTKEKIKDFASKGKKKDLIDAYEIAKEGVTMDQIREAFTADPMAVDDEEAEGEADEEAEVEEEEADEDEEEEDVEEGDSKGSKKKGTKRKKADDSDEEMEEPEKKPTKTPKRGTTAKTPTKTKAPKSTVKTPIKTPNGAAKAKTPTSKAKSTKKTPSKKETPSSKKSSKSKKTVTESDDEEAGAESEASGTPTKKPTKPKEDPAVVAHSPEEEKERRKKEILYIRHRLQKGLLTRGTVPSDEEMPILSSHFDTLEKFEDLEVSVIRSTKINKVLKMITKLSSIPQDETYKLRERSIALLEKVNQRLAEEPEEEQEGKGEDKQNGSEEAPSKDEKTNGATIKKGGDSDKANEEGVNGEEAEKENSNAISKKDLKEVEMRDAPEGKTTAAGGDEDIAMSE